MSDRQLDIDGHELEPDAVRLFEREGAQVRGQTALELPAEPA
jgi:hypothetical protein